MILKTLTFQEVQERHPDVVEFAIGKLKAGTSKHKNALPNELKWEYDICVACSAHDVDVNNIRKPKISKKDIETIIVDRVARTRTSIKVSIGRWSAYYNIKNPPEVEVNARKQITKNIKEQQEFDALPIKEKDRIRNECLSQLIGTPGFTMIGIK